MNFLDRRDAGAQLASKLKRYSGEAVVYALPRGGIILGSEVARELDCPLDLILVRKITHPDYPEYAIGAIAEGSDPVFNVSDSATVDDFWLRRAVAEGQAKNTERRHSYFPTEYEPPTVAGRTAILVDDGLATGLTMKAAALAVRRFEPRAVIVAVPVAPMNAIQKLEGIADEIVVLDNPAHYLGAVGSHYNIFPQITDKEVVDILKSRRA